MVQDTIEQEMVIAAPVERVWAALTTAEHLGTWFADAGATIDLRPGGAMSLTWREHGTGLATVEAVEPPHRFAFRWTKARDTDPAASGDATLVSFTLTPSGEGTLLRLVESGFASTSGDDAAQDAFREGNVGGWTSELAELRDHVTRTADVPA